MRVLIVDDNDITGSALAEYLTSRGVEADWVENVSSALTRISLQIPDVVLLDIFMVPVLGTTLLSHLSQHEEWKKINVVIFTAATDKDLSHIPPNLPLIRKPVDPEVLLEYLLHNYQDNSGTPNQK